MAYVFVEGMLIPAIPQITPVATFNASLLIDATGEKAAMIGRVWNKDRTSKAITKVGFRFGVIVKAGGSGLTVSLQNVDLANGPPFQPDGTQDQTVAIANGDAGFASNVWMQTAALSANRTVSFGELLAVVIEYDGNGRLGADSVQISTHNAVGNTHNGLVSGGVLNTAGAWALQALISNVILEFSDGTFGTLDYSVPASALATPAFNTGTNPDERALEFSLSFPCKVDGFWLFAQVASGADLDVVLYDGTTPMDTVSFDSNAFGQVTVGRVVWGTFASEQTLAPNHVYRLAVKPTTANSVTLYEFDVSSANHFQAHPGGTSFVHNTRNDAGAWGTATTTKRPFMGLRVSALEYGVSPTYALGI